MTLRDFEIKILNDQGAALFRSEYVAVTKQYASLIELGEFASARLAHNIRYGIAFQLYQYARGKKIAGESETWKKILDELLNMTDQHNRLDINNDKEDTH